MGTVLRQKWVFRSDLRCNPNVLYLFGDNIGRVGLGGQAKEMRGEQNAVGVATKNSPSADDGAFFTDENVIKQSAQIKDDLDRVEIHLALGGIVIIPTDGLGTGLSELPTRAPLTNAYLESSLSQLEHL